MGLSDISFYVWPKHRKNKEGQKDLNSFDHNISKLNKKDIEIDKLIKEQPVIVSKGQTWEKTNKNSNKKVKKNMQEFIKHTSYSTEKALLKKAQNYCYLNEPFPLSHPTLDT